MNKRCVFDKTEYKSNNLSRVEVQPNCRKAKENSMKFLLLLVHGLPTRGGKIKFESQTENNSAWQTTWGPGCLDQEVETTANIILEGKKNQIKKR